MNNRTEIVEHPAPADPYSGNSLVPMLVGGIALTLLGMLMVLLLT
jgi:hypothetical protein